MSEKRATAYEYIIIALMSDTIISSAYQNLTRPNACHVRICFVFSSTTLLLSMITKDQRCCSVFQAYQV